MVKVINNYTLIDKIGEGNYGEVYRAYNSKKMGQFAVKIIPIQKFQQNNLLQQCTINEVKTLSTIGACQYIVRYEEHFQTKNNYYFVYEYCNGGTLMDIIKRQGHFPQKRALSVFRQLLEAFKVLNRFNIMHRDLKPENILFNNGKIKLGDFGFCKGLKPGEHMAKTMLGSPIYMAPEVLRGENYTTKADIWSLGVVLYEMLFGICPYQSKSIAMLISTINTNDIGFPLQTNPISEKTQNLLKKLLTKDYFRRISWIQLFGYKIQEDGNFNQIQNTPKSPSPFNSSNKSYSTIKDGSEKQLILQTSVQYNKKPSSLHKQHNKMKFYSQKYMNAVMQPMHNAPQKTNQRKISLFGENLMEKFLQKQEQPIIKFNSQKKLNDINEKHYLMMKESQQPKRQRLLKKHEQCLIYLQQSLQYLQKRQEQAISESYMTLLRVQAKLKQITEQIIVTQTSLLDVASLINYQMIQVDRQLIETKQQLLRRKMQIPKYDKLIFKSLQATPKTPQIQTKIPVFCSNILIEND